MKWLVPVFLVPTSLWAIEYGVERYYQLSEYVAYELEQCPALVTASMVFADKQHATAPPYDPSSIFVYQPPRQDAVSNVNIAGGIFVAGLAVMQCMDWWIKRNQRIQQFVATYSTWTRDDYQCLFEGSCRGAADHCETAQHEWQSSMSRQSICAETEWHLPNDKVFPLYHHYQFRGFREYLKTRVGYEQEILSLAAALERKDKKVRKAIKHMPGCSRTQFTALIHDMVSDIERARVLRAQQERRRVFVQHIMRVLKSELMDTLAQPYTWRAIGTLAKYIAPEHGEVAALLDGCYTCTAC